jgi:hypothetical protein
VPQVDLVIQAHFHGYSRSCMLYKGACVQPSPSTAPQQQQQQQQKQQQEEGEPQATGAANSAQQPRHPQQRTATRWSAVWDWLLPRLPYSSRSSSTALGQPSTATPQQQQAGGWAKEVAAAARRRLSMQQQQQQQQPQQQQQQQPERAPVYLLAGNAGSNSSLGWFMDPLPDWVEFAAEAR